MNLQTVKTRKFFLVDANVLVDYYTNANRDVCRVFGDIEKKRKNSSSADVVVFVPNICIAEVYKTLASKRYDESQDRRLGESEYNKARLAFSNDISRTDQWSGIDDKRVKEREDKVQKYFHLELSRYHILNGHSIYPFVWKANDKEKRKYLSGIDILIIAQGMEFTKFYGRANFAILTSDMRMHHLGKILQGLTDNDLKSCGLIEMNRHYYPKVINARDFKEYRSFLNER